MAIREATSASRADVLDAYNAADTGDTVLLPQDGESTWSSTIEVSKAITIDGNGTTLTGGVEMSYGFFHLKDLTSADLVRITNFTFDLNDIDGGSALYFSGLALTNLRIDHNTIHHGTTALGDVKGCKGVIDSNAFYNGWSTLLCSAGTRVQADASWVSMAAGTGDALFIEDNDFITDGNYTGGDSNYHILDSYQGGKLVFRYNTIDATEVPSTDTFWTIQIHGNAAGGQDYGYWQAAPAARRGQSVIEIYENIITGKKISRLAIIRGSANLVYNNSVTATIGAPTLNMFEEEAFEAQFDPLRTEWPAEDQVHNSFFWGNTFNGVAQDSDDIVVQAGSETFIQEDRDYFLHRPATTGEGMTLGKETFTDKNGAAGTHPTDGDPYANQGTMEFTADVENEYYGYTPYTYPHPLRSGPSGEGPFASDLLAVVLQLLAVPIIQILLAMGGAGWLYTVTQIANRFLGG